MAIFKLLNLPQMISRKIWKIWEVITSTLSDTWMEYECTYLFTYFRETLSINNGDLELTGFDLGGHKQIRRIWKDYYEAVDAVVFMVDASDISRLAEAKSELQLVINDTNLRRRKIPILIMANKIDAQVCDNYRSDDQSDHRRDYMGMIEL